MRIVEPKQSRNGIVRNNDEIHREKFMRDQRSIGNTFVKVRRREIIVRHPKRIVSNGSNRYNRKITRRIDITQLELYDTRKLDGSAYTSANDK